MRYLGYIVALFVMIAVANLVAQFAAPTLTRDSAGRRVAYRVLVWAVLLVECAILMLVGSRCSSDVY